MNATPVLAPVIGAPVIGLARQLPHRTQESLHAILTVSLDGELDILAREQLRGPLARAVDSHPLVRIDLSEVSFLDASGVRLLLETVARARHRGHQAWLCEPSQAVRRVFGLLGLGAALTPAPSAA